MCVVRILLIITHPEHLAVGSSSTTSEIHSHFSPQIHNFFTWARVQGPYVSRNRTQVLRFTVCRLKLLSYRSNSTQGWTLIRRNGKANFTRQKHNFCIGWGSQSFHTPSVINTDLGISAVFVLSQLSLLSQGRWMKLAALPPGLGSRSSRSLSTVSASSGLRDLCFTLSFDTSLSSTDSFALP